MEFEMQQIDSAAARESSGAGETLKVMTYNVLAQTYTRSSYFPYCHGPSLRWKTRSANLKKVFTSMPVQPTLISLQEVDAEYYYGFWLNTMQELGYKGIFAQKTTKKEGVAIFYHDATIDLVDQRKIDLDHPAGDESDVDDDLRWRAERGSVGILATFKFSSFEFVVSNTHLFWNPEHEDVKLLQTKRLLHHISLYSSLPLIFTGDLNSLPGSLVYNYLTSVMQFQSAYGQYANGEPEFTNVNGQTAEKEPAFVGTLDYIFYNSPQLIPKALLKLMSKDQATSQISLPSAFSPSDHLPLLCEFNIAT